MKRLNVLLLGLTVSLILLSGIAGSRIAFAQEGEGDLGCSLLSNCLPGASCGGRGTVADCKITCEGGGTINCPLGGQGN